MMDEFKNFDPQARWAEANNENLKLKRLEDEALQREEIIVELLKKGPVKSGDIAKKLRIHTSSVPRILKRMRLKMNIVTESTKLGTFYSLG